MKVLILWKSWKSNSIYYGKESCSTGTDVEKETAVQVKYAVQHA